MFSSSLTSTSIISENPETSHPRPSRLDEALRDSRIVGPVQVDLAYNLKQIGLDEEMSDIIATGILTAMYRGKTIEEMGSSLRAYLQPLSYRDTPLLSLLKRQVQEGGEGHHHFYHIGPGETVIDMKMWKDHPKAVERFWLLDYILELTTELSAD